MSSTMVLSTDCREIPAPFWFLFMGCRRLCALIPGPPHPSLTSLTLIFTELLLTLAFPQLLYVPFYFLKYAFPEVSPSGLRGSAVPCNGCWSQLELAVFGMGQSLASSQLPTTLTTGLCSPH